MAWDARGRWIPDDVRKQTRQLSGLLAQPQTAVPATNQALPPQPLPAATTPPGATVDPRVKPARAGHNPPPVPVPTPTPTPTPAPAPTPVPGTTPPPAPGIDPGADPTLEDESTAGRLNGLLGQNSIYMQLAREGGVRTAGRRGLLNSSIAAGSGEAAAIAAALPIASQDASQIHERNQARITSALQYRSASGLQSQQDAAAMARQLSSQASAATLQAADLKAAMERLGLQTSTEKQIATLNATTSLNQTQISANASLIGNYMEAIGQLAGNPEIPATTRNAYITEFQRVLQAGSGLSSTIAKAPVSWTGGTTTGGTTASGSTSGTRTGLLGRVGATA